MANTEMPWYTPRIHKQIAFCYIVALGASGYGKCSQWNTTPSGVGECKHDRNRNEDHADPDCNNDTVLMVDNGPTQATVFPLLSLTLTGRG